MSQGSCDAESLAESEVVAVMPTGYPIHGAYNLIPHALKFRVLSSDIPR